MKKIAILGSTGSIGREAVAIASRLSDMFEVVALAAGSNIDVLEQQVKLLSPKFVAVHDERMAQQLQKRLGSIRVLGGMEGVCEVAMAEGVQMVIAAIVGAAGILPVIRAIESGKDIALANKEVLVAAGAYVMQIVQKNNITMVPIDSEHSALFQCLQGENPSAIDRLIITASGGPFHDWPKERLQQVTICDALKHPNFSMGKKITVDSSTMMNKGLEVIEASWLFHQPMEKIEVVVHPQQMIHSMVSYIDGSILAQMGKPHMTVPIQYAMTYPQRTQGSMAPFDFSRHYSMNFFPPDVERFRCLHLAYAAQKQGRLTPCFLNAANEVLVERFLQGEISWMAIGEKLEKLLQEYRPIEDGSLEAIFFVDQMARKMAKNI